MESNIQDNLLDMVNTLSNAANNLVTLRMVNHADLSRLETVISKETDDHLSPDISTYRVDPVFAGDTLYLAITIPIISESRKARILSIDPIPSFIDGVKYLPDCSDSHIHVQLVNEQVTSAVYHVIAMIEDIDYNDKLSEIHTQNHTPGSMQKLLVEAFERHSSFHRNQEVIHPGYEDDLYLATLLSWNGDMIMKLESSCGENYVHPITSIENITISELNDTELSVIQTIQGVSIVKFLSIKQKPDEDLYAYSMRICHDYRVMYPHENPMNSLACKRVFIKGLNDYHLLFFKKFSLQDIIQNSSITFREIFGWLYLYAWLDKYKYSSSCSVNSLNPPPMEESPINPIDKVILETNKAFIRSRLKANCCQNRMTLVGYARASCVRPRPIGSRAWDANKVTKKRTECLHLLLRN